MRLNAAALIIAGFVVGFIAVFSIVEPRATAALKAQPKVFRPAPPVPAGRAPGVDAQLLRQLETEVQANPSNFDAVVQLANLNYDQRNFPEAARFFGKALELRPAEIDLRTDYATVLFYSQRVDEALAEFQKVLNQSPNHPPALFNMGVVLLQARNDPAGAIEHWQRLVDTHPEYPQIELVKKQIENLRQSVKK